MESRKTHHTKHTMDGFEMGKDQQGQRHFREINLLAVHRMG